MKDVYKTLDMIIHDVVALNTHATLFIRQLAVIRSRLLEATELIGEYEKKNRSLEGDGDGI